MLASWMVGPVRCRPGGALSAVSTKLASREWASVAAKATLPSLPDWQSNPRCPVTIFPQNNEVQKVMVKE